MLVRPCYGSTENRNLLQDEIWAVRDAILQGAKIDNLVLRSLKVRSGLVKPFCKNCKVTFADFMTSMK